VITRLVRNQYLDGRLDDVARATVLSSASMVLAPRRPARLVAGAGTEAAGTMPFLAAAGVVVPLLGLALWVVVSPVRDASGAQGAGAGTASAAD
jgi:hypothetical protein